jgi:hypothetical protein
VAVALQWAGELESEAGRFPRKASPEPVPFFECGSSVISLLGVAAQENMLLESHCDRVERFAPQTPFGLRHRRKFIVRKGGHLSSLSEIAAKLMNPLIFLGDL